jgi:hypothetical protein
MKQSSTTRVLSAIREKSAGAKSFDNLIRASQAANTGSIIDTVDEFLKAGGEMDLSCSICGRSERLIGAAILERYEGSEKLRVIAMDCDKTSSCGAIAMPSFPGQS